MLIKREKWPVKENDHPHGGPVQLWLCDIELKQGRPDCKTTVVLLQNHYYIITLHRFSSTKVLQLILYRTFSSNSQVSSNKLFS